MYNHQLDTFIQVADTGSFGKAAELLYVSAPAVMKQIRLLEDKCKVTLFNRTHQGVTLTAAGQSLYNDAKTIIRLSNDAINKAQQLADKSENTVRIGTSVLFKCRMLPTIWNKVSEKYPELKIEIIPIPDKQSREESIYNLGLKYDIREGILSTLSLKDRCNFLQLTNTPVCCAVSKNHRLADYNRLTLDDLNGEYLVMPIKGVSAELDKFRSEIQNNYPTVQIIDSPYYGVDTFTFCEVNQYVLMTHPVFSDIHTSLVTIPLETNYSLPYGLMYSNTPTPATQRFISETEKLNFDIFK